LSPTHFTQALVANVILAVGTAVVVFDAQFLPALLGGICAGTSIYVWFHRRHRRTDNAPERK